MIYDIKKLRNCAASVMTVITLRKMNGRRVRERKETIIHSTESKKLDYSFYDFEIAKSGRLRKELNK